MTQDKNINNLIINKLTKAQYDNIQNPSATELYLVTDDIGITSNDIITALGYTPYNSTNPNGYITSSALNGYATETWVGNQGYLTGITSSDIITALTYTPYNGATNPNGYITSADLPTNYVTTDTAQDISGKKTFLGEKAIYFKQQATTNKLGFTLYNPSNTELGALEYRPNTISGNALLNLNCPQTTGGYVGFRYWGTPAVNIVAPKVATAGNYFIPTHITDGSTTVTASNTGTVNISTLLPDISTKQDTLVSGTNIKTINNTSLLGSGNIDTEEVFIAEYGVTTYAEVMAALQSHKIVFVIKNGFIYTYQTVSGLMNLFVRWCYYFNGSTNIDGVDTEGVYVNQNDVWYTTSNTFEFQQLLVSGTNIKTINNQSILGRGDLSIPIPTAISDLTDDTSTTPIDKAESVADQRDSSSLKYWTGTKAQYDAIATKDNDTIYNVEDTTSPIVDILNTLYPIGAIYIGTMATCPLSVLGVGTWQLVAQDRVLQGAGTRGAVGTTINESLPNIKGSGWNIGGASNSDWTGAFNTNVTTRFNISSGTANGGGTLTFDASRSSSTYQNNAPVQQDGYLVNIWERVA